MARRRMIDPNFWQSEDVSNLSIRQRLLLIGLFSNADDEGKLRGNPAFVRSLVFPYEDFTLIEIEQDLNKVEEVGSIHQYTVESNKYIRLVNWRKFQRVDKPQVSVIPEPIDNHSKNDSKNDSGESREPLLPKGKEEKGKEDEEKGREETIPPSDKFNSIHSLLKKYEIEKFTTYSIEILGSYIGVVEFEVIEIAIKKAEKKHINYAINIIEGWIKEGKTTKEQVTPKPPTNLRNNQPRKDKLPMFKGEDDEPLSPEEKEEIKKKMREFGKGA